VAPRPETVKIVKDWLASAGIQTTKLSQAGDWIGFAPTVQQANELFDADFTIYEHSATGSQQIRTLSYSLPASLRSHVNLVHPTTSYASK
jgi:tripeptidyl-peptidase-1